MRPWLSGKFPRPIPLGERAVGWLEAEIDSWIEALPPQARWRVLMNAAQWPETVAAGISLIEIALGPEIAEEAYAIVMGMNTFESGLPQSRRQR